MNLFRLFFPARNRSFPGKRWTRVVLRTLHLVGTAGVGGGFLYESSREAWMPYLILTAVSGLAIVLLELWSNGIWIIQLRGAAILAKLGLLAGLHGGREWAAAALVASVVVSGLISHAPGEVRYFSILHGKRMDTL
jgi:hypothetical protein